jgi:carboxylesterase
MSTFILGAEPFFFEGNRTGCLLIHGFTGTPYEMRGLGEWLHAQFNYTISGPALAGHATRVEDCVRTVWHDWYASVAHAYHELAARCDNVFAIGLSLGGALVLHLAAQAGEHTGSPLQGIISLAAPIHVEHPQVRWFRALPLLHSLIPYVKKNDANDDTQDPTVRAKHPSYDRNPTRAARSLILDFLPHLRAELPSIQIPALLIQAGGDRTVPADSLTIIYAEIGSQDKQMVWLERGGHLILEDYGNDQAFQLIAEFINRHLPLTLDEQITRAYATPTS